MSWVSSHHCSAEDGHHTVPLALKLPVAAPSPNIHELHVSAEGWPFPIDPLDSQKVPCEALKRWQPESISGRKTCQKRMLFQYLDVNNDQAHDDQTSAKLVIYNSLLLIIISHHEPSCFPSIIHQPLKWLLLTYYLLTIMNHQTIINHQINRHEPSIIHQHSSATTSPPHQIACSTSLATPMAGRSTVMPRCVAAPQPRGWKTPFLGGRGIHGKINGKMRFL